MKRTDFDGGWKGALRIYKMLYDADKLVVILHFPSSILRAIKPYISILATAYILDGFITGQTLMHLLYIALGAVLLAFAVNFIEGYLTKSLQIHNDSIVPEIYMQKAAKYMSMDFELLESPIVNKINDRIARDSQWSSGFYSLSGYLRSLLDSFFGFVVGIIMIIPFFSNSNVSGGIIFIMILLVFATATTIINSKIQNKQTQHMNSSDPKYDTKYQSYFFFSGRLSNLLKTARIYNMNNLLSGYFDVDDRHQYEFNKVYTKYSCESALIKGLASGIMTTSAYLFIVARAIYGAVSASNVVRYAGTIYNTTNSFLGLSSSFTNFISQTNRVQGILELMEIKNVLYKGTLPVEKRSDNQYIIEFHNVSFKYPGSDNYSLRNFSIKLNIGQSLAIVGMNGSGKTTMIKLLCRLYDPTEGIITLNGVDIKKYDYVEYIKMFSVVFQDFKIFSLKLSENIAYSTDFCKEKVSKVINLVGLSERIEKMQDGLDTYLYNDYDNGVEISGGEAQKIALARALYKNAPFIILDEPTSALDPIAEFEIYSKFNEIIGGKTAIYISHRLSSCRFCDDIAVFHDGELIQRGSHSDLITDINGKYCELWTAQAQYYNEK